MKKRKERQLKKLNETGESLRPMILSPSSDSTLFYYPSFFPSLHICDVVQEHILQVHLTAKERFILLTCSSINEQQHESVEVELFTYSFSREDGSGFNKASSSTRHLYWPLVAATGSYCGMYYSLLVSVGISFQFNVRYVFFI